MAALRAAAPFLATPSGSLCQSGSSFLGRPVPGAPLLAACPRVTGSADGSRKTGAGVAAVGASMGLMSLVGGPAAASDLLSAGATTGVDLTTTLGGLAAAAAAGVAAVKLTDPEARRKRQAAETGGDEMAVVRNYFNTVGADRWRRIYGDTDDVNKVQLDIRQGHAQTVEKVVGWLKETGNLQGRSVCDVGCGTGSLAVPLAMEGARVTASDIAQAMVAEAEKRWASNGGPAELRPKFETADLESVTGRYNTVCCLDVLIHYPDEKAAGMISHLASLAEERLIISFAPKTLYYSVLKRIGELFPGPSKATRAYLHAEADVEKALNAAGFKVQRREMTATSFYFSRLLEAVKA